MKVSIYPYKSKLEVEVQKLLPKAPYEQDKLTYVKEHTYNPDFTLAPNIFVEAKGRFVAADRAKHLAVKKQHPDATVYFVFERPYNTLSKASKTTYAEWCTKNGYIWFTVDEIQQNNLLREALCNGNVTTVEKLKNSS